MKRSADMNPYFVLPVFVISAVFLVGLLFFYVQGLAPNTHVSLTPEQQRALVGMYGGPPSSIGLFYTLIIVLAASCILAIIFGIEHYRHKQPPSIPQTAIGQFLQFDFGKWHLLIIMTLLFISKS